jgi:hypothetical protein
MTGPSPGTGALSARLLAPCRLEVMKLSPTNLQERAKLVRLATRCHRADSSQCAAYAACHMAGLVRFVVEGSAFVVAEARLIVRVEDFGHKISATVNAGLVEDAFEVFLDGVHRQRQVLGDIDSGAALQDESGDVLLPSGQSLRGHQQGIDAGGMGRFDDHGDAPGGARGETCSMQHHPDAASRQHSCDRDLARAVAPVTGS